MTSRDKGELDGTSGDLGVSLLKLALAGTLDLSQRRPAGFRLGIGDSPDTG